MLSIADLMIFAICDLGQETAMKIMLMLMMLMMSCTVFAEPPSEVQRDTKSVLTAYSRMFGQSSVPLDPKLIRVYAGGTADWKTENDVTIFIVGKTVFVVAARWVKGKGITVAPVCGRENIIKLADSLAKPPIMPDIEWINKHADGRLDLLIRMTSVSSLDSQLRIFRNLNATDLNATDDHDVHIEIASKIGNIGKISMAISLGTAKAMSNAIRHYIPLSGGVLEVNSELLTSARTKVAGLLDDAKKLREQGERNDALKVLITATAIIDEAQQSVPKGVSLSLSNQKKLLGLEFAACVLHIGLGLTEADKATDEVAGINAVRQIVNEWGREKWLTSPTGGLSTFLKTLREQYVLKDGDPGAANAQIQRRFFFASKEVKRLKKLEKNRKKAYKGRNVHGKFIPLRDPWVDIPLATLESRNGG